MSDETERYVRDGVVIEFPGSLGWVGAETDLILNFDPVPSVEDAHIFPSVPAASAWIAEFVPEQRPFRVWWRSAALAAQDQQYAAYLADLRA